MNLDAFFAALYAAPDIDVKLKVLSEFTLGGRFDLSNSQEAVSPELPVVAPPSEDQTPVVAPVEPVAIPPFLEQTPAVDVVAVDTVSPTEPV